MHHYLTSVDAALLVTDFNMHRMRHIDRIFSGHCSFPSLNSFSLSVMFAPFKNKPLMKSTYGKIMY